MRLARCLPRTRALLENGQITVPRARRFIDELTRYDNDLAAQIDAQLADRAAGLAPWRITQEVHRAAAKLDPDATALATAAANADRSATLEPLVDDQALVLLQGPAVPLTRWYTTLTQRARALKASGDPRTLAQLRFDLATSTYPCTTHPPTHPPTAAAPQARRRTSTVLTLPPTRCARRPGCDRASSRPPPPTAG
jgi:hypothetical protein